MGHPSTRSYGGAGLGVLLLLACSKSVAGSDAAAPSDLPRDEAADGAGDAPDAADALPDAPVDAPADGANDAPPDAACVVGRQRCDGATSRVCVADGVSTREQATDCAAMGLACVAGRGCLACAPDAVRCAPTAPRAERCAADGSAWVPGAACDMAAGQVCRSGACVDACTDEIAARTSAGCEFWGVDLDNITEMGGRSAASQQFAIIVTNPDPVATARVEVHRNTAAVGAPASLERVGSAALAPRAQEVFRLPAREVDCSTRPDANDGSGTCLSANAYRVTSNLPVVAHQFNPLENVGVFSNDASLLLPTRALDGAYRVIGYPQQYAVTTDPDTNSRADYRAFVTIVGTAADTSVTVTPTADVIPGGPLTARARAGAPFTVRLGAFDVLNLESGGFLADFTGSTISATRPVAVFSGTECSDVPSWTTFSTRQPACDHLEEQLYPSATLGVRYAASRTPGRSRAVRDAGATTLSVVNEPEWFRVLNPGAEPVRVTTTLPADAAMPAGPALSFTLMAGERRDLRALSDFLLESSGPVSVAQLVASQGLTGIPFTLPGGDPELLLPPPVSQWRSEYVFVVPPTFSFDFVQVVARPGARVLLGDGATEAPVSSMAGCASSRLDACADAPGRPCAPPAYVTWRCQLSAPTLDMSVTPPVINPGVQRDGVYTVRAEPATPGGPPETAMVIVSGFDRYVSYAFVAGTDLARGGM